MAPHFQTHHPFVSLLSRHYPPSIPGKLSLISQKGQQQPSHPQKACISGHYHHPIVTQTTQSPFLLRHPFEKILPMPLSSIHPRHVITDFVKNSLTIRHAESMCFITLVTKQMSRVSPSQPPTLQNGADPIVTRLSCVDSPSTMS